MTDIRQILLAALIIFCLLFPVTVWGADDCTVRLAKLEQQNKNLHRQLREVKRELALVKSRKQEAGWPQALAGIGVIFGLCGVGMMFSARKKLRAEELD